MKSMMKDDIKGINRFFVFLLNGLIFYVGYTYGLSKTFSGIFPVISIWQTTALYLIVLVVVHGGLFYAES